MSKTNFEFLDALSQIARDKGISPRRFSTRWRTPSWLLTRGARVQRRRRS